MAMTIYTILLLGAVLVSSYTLFVELPRSAVFAARSNLFALRDQLFALGASGEIPFGSRSYQMVRGLLNGMIRYSDDVSLVDMIITKLLRKDAMSVSAKRLGKRMEKEFRKLSPEAERKLETILKAAHTELVMLMVNRSIGLTLTLRTVWLISVAHSLCVSFFRLARAKFKRKERPAHHLGRNSEKAFAVANQPAFKALEAKTRRGIDVNSFALAGPEFALSC